MSNRQFCVTLVAAAAPTSSAGFGQIDIQFRARQMPGWDARAREGRCEIRVWVDNRAEVRMRRDAIFVRTLEGAKRRDEDSNCSQPLSYNSVSGFEIHQTTGRTRVILAQQLNRMNNYTALIEIEDRQGGEDAYAFEVPWHSEAGAVLAEEALTHQILAGRTSSKKGAGAEATRAYQ
jgi:hypothetical protein